MHGLIPPQIFVFLFGLSLSLGGSRLRPFEVLKDTELRGLITSRPQTEFLFKLWVNPKNEAARRIVTSARHQIAIL
jgi:hypothetical protein